MALDVDVVLDRRRLLRRAAIWRALAILVVLGAIGGGIVASGGLRGEHIARLPIEGAIVSDRKILTLVDKLAKDDKVAAVLVSINSPGGTSVGGERLYNALRELDERKPVVAHITTLGASAAYMAAIASDHIVAQRTSLTGSVGVLIQYGQINQLLENWGIQVDKVESGALKAEPNPFQPAPPAAVAVLQSVVDDTFDWFIGLVKDRRELSDAQVARIGDGRIFTGAQALDAGLIDAIGGEKTAVDWLVAERGVPRGLTVRGYEVGDEADDGFLARMGDRVVDRLFATIGLRPSPFDGQGPVDGLWSLWQARAPSDLPEGQ
ncbi:MAG: signal peptide peptidase SppA [Pseudomonadota bacterium]